MSDNDRTMMDYAIELASSCEPKDPSLIPKVGAVIDIGGEVFVGQRGEDDHAEKNALDNVAKKGLTRLLKEATVYTTLEPCTKHVRRKLGESCNERLIQARVKRVVIGILDPYQGVCGKEVLELQAHNIEVSLFPHDLAEKILLLNSEFVRAQKSLGIKIISPHPNEELHTYKTAGNWTIRCTCINPPGNDVFVLVNQVGLWWPQREKLRRIGDTDMWEAKVSFGTPGRFSLHIVKASDLGVAMIEYFQKMNTMIVDQRKRLINHFSNTDEIKKIIQSEYRGIVMSTSLPKGLDTEAFVDVLVVADPDQI